MSTVAELFSRITTLLNDTYKVRWTEPELLQWFNDGLRDTSVIDPAASQKSYVDTLDPGAKQSLPAEAMLLIDIVGNVAAGGAAAKQIRMCDRATLDAAFPGWQMETPKASIQNVMYDPRYRRTYWVYPPAVAGIQIELVYSFIPVVVATTDTVPLDPIYNTPLVDYVLYRSLSKDSEAGNAQRAAGYLSTFTAAVQAIVATRTGSAPKE